MASISQLRPRSAEAEALVYRLSSDDNLKMDPQAASEEDDNSEHSNAGAMSGQVYNMMQQALQCTWGNMLTIANALAVTHANCCKAGLHASVYFCQVC